MLVPLYYPPCSIRKTIGTDFAGCVRYQLNTPYRDGTTHIIFEPLDFMAKLVTLVPKPRANLMRCYGVLAPNSRQRIYVNPAKRERARPKSWAWRSMSLRGLIVIKAWSGPSVKRVFNIDITFWSRCGGAVSIIVCIEYPSIITNILAHLDAKSGAPEAVN